MDIIAVTKGIQAVVDELGKEQEEDEVETPEKEEKEKQEDSL